MSALRVAVLSSTVRRSTNSFLGSYRKYGGHILGRSDFGGKVTLGRPVLPPATAYGCLSRSASERQSSDRARFAWHRASKVPSTIGHAACYFTGPEATNCTNLPLRLIHRREVDIPTSQDGSFGRIHRTSNTRCTSLSVQQYT